MASGGFRFGLLKIELPTRIASDKRANNVRSTSFMGS